jgi:hypothetical protein
MFDHRLCQGRHAQAIRPKLRLPHFRSRNGFCAVQKSFLDLDDEYRARRFSVDRQTHLQSLFSRDTPFAADANTVAVLGNKEEETDLGIMAYLLLMCCVRRLVAGRTRLNNLPIGAA